MLSVVLEEEELNRSIQAVRSERGSKEGLELRFFLLGFVRTPDTSRVNTPDLKAGRERESLLDNGSSILKKGFRGLKNVRKNTELSFNGKYLLAISLSFMFRTELFDTIFQDELKSSKKIERAPELHRNSRTNGRQ